MKAWLLVEAVALFGGLPVLFDFAVRRGYRRLLFPSLWLLAAVAVLVLRSDPSFDGSRLWSVHVEPFYARVIVVRAALTLVILAALSWRLTPESFLALPRRMPGFWVLLAILYPLVSVLPQGILWRVFLVHRYAPMLGSGALLLVVGTAAFAWAHLAFRNTTAIVLTGLGGGLFLHTYLATGSMLVSSLEHALYGVAAFTFGVGRSLVLGQRRVRGATTLSAHASGEEVSTAKQR
jgi:hypothetical protein